MKDKNVCRQKVLPACRRELAAKVHLFAVTSTENRVEAVCFLPSAPPNPSAKTDRRRHFQHFPIIRFSETLVECLYIFASRQRVLCDELRITGDGRVIRKRGYRRCSGVVNTVPHEPL